MQAGTWQKDMFVCDHAGFAYCIPFDLRVDVIVGLASQCAITAANALGLVYDHYPLMFPVWCIA
jgi:hypothetical protein